MSIASLQQSMQPPLPTSADEDDVDPALEELDKKINTSSYITNRVVVTSEGALDPSQLVRTEGYMWKKGGAVNARGGFRNWKKRWFVLAPVEFLGSQAYELQYYDAPNGSLKGKVGLTDVEVHCEKKVHKNSKKLVKFEFQLILQNGGILELSCDNEEEREEWLDTLGIVITFLRKITTSNVMTLNGYDPSCEDDEESFRIGEEIAQNCQAFGPGLFGVEAGKLTQFLVQIYDLNGQKVSIGGMPVSATIQNDSSLYHLAVQDHEDGTYSVSYTLGRSGKYKLNITLNEEHHIFGSPYEIEVLPSKTVTSMCFAEGEALLKIPTKQVSTFTIIAVDNYGNRKLRGGDPFEIGIMGPAQLIHLKDNDDGTYTCAIEVLNIPSPASLTATGGKSGTGTIQFSTILIMITLYGKPIKGSPFKPTVFDPPSIANVSSARGNTPKPAASARARQEQTANPTDQILSSSALVGGPPIAALTFPQPSKHGGGTSDNGSLAPQQVKAKQLAQSVVNQNSIQAQQRYPNPTAAGVSSARTATQPLEFSLEGNSHQSPLSRLERSRQRALLAKSLSESNNGKTALSNSLTQRNPRTPMNSAESVISSTFGVPLHTLMKADESVAPSIPPVPTTPLAAGSSKLSQLAQRNAAALQALRLSQPVSGSPLSGEAPSANGDGISSPLPNKPRNTFLTELATNLKQGLGKMNASLSSSSTPTEIELWDATHRALTDDKIIEKLLNHVETIFQLFLLFADRVEGVSVIKLITTKGHGGISRLLELYEIIPNFLTKAEAKVLYNRILLAQRALKLPASIAGGGSAIDFSSFLRLLVMVAIFTLSKTDLLANHYSTMEVKLDVLLYKWGVADQHRLGLVRQLLANQNAADL